MKKLSIFFLSLIFLFKITALEAYSSDPKNFVAELVNDAIEKLSSTTLSKEEKALFVEEIALNNVDIKALGLYTLGELRKSLDKKDIENYQQTFKSYFLKLNFKISDYSSSKFEVIEAEQKAQIIQLSNQKFYQIMVIQK